MTGGSTGRFWAVGVGPGDPDLLTVKAVRILQQVAVIYHAGPEERAGRAWQIVRGVARPEQAVRVVRTDAMNTLTNGGRAGYRAGVEQIAADCRRGLDVAFVAEGDPTLYSTAAAVWQLLTEVAPEVPIEVVPGVSSITAAAARVRWPLAQKDEALAVVPAGYHRDDLASLLRTFPNVALLKVPQALAGLQRVLAEVRPDCETVYAENIGTEREWVTHDLAAATGRKEYFALVLVRRRVGQVCNLPEAEGRLQTCPTKLWVVGLGPGDPRLLTGQALDVLRAAEVLVGYDGYLDLLAPLGLTAERHGSPIGAEAERAAHALALAREGRRVVLVSSGDAGVYGMASLVLETAERLPGVDVEIVPGVTAATAAAAVLGAPLGHDFACVSLSDLLTPWEVIERRLDAAGRGDLVLALYNPASRRRTWQLPRAREVLLRHRGPGTPVGVVDRAFRPGTRVTHTTLGDLSPEGVTMETLLIVGSSRTRVVNGRMVTPRGYGTQA
jgi:precorrin-2 C20-methyltransferase/precorrin-3B C17-methyltransferase